MSGILAQGARFHLGVRPKTRRLRSYESKKPSGQDAHLAEKKQNAIHTGTYERCCCAAVPGATLRSAF